MHQTKPREYSMLPSVTTHLLFTETFMMSVVLSEVRVLLY